MSWAMMHTIPTYSNPLSGVLPVDDNLILVPEDDAKNQYDNRNRSL